MNVEKLRRYCLSFPHATESLQWGDHLVFKVAGKIFAITSVEAESPHKLSCKCELEAFADLTERPGVVPAPYMARNHWIALEEFSALDDGEIEALVATSYRLVVERLPKKTRNTLAGAATPRPRAVNPKAGRPSSPPEATFGSRGRMPGPPDAPPRRTRGRRGP